MNKKLTLTLVIISILVFTFASAFNTQPSITGVSLLSVKFQKEKGVTLKFLVTGDFHKKDLQGYILVGGKKVGLFCPYNDIPSPAVVTCHAAQGTAARYAGRRGMVYLAGVIFPISIPARLP